jgi:hypothetical protein
MPPVEQTRSVTAMITTVTARQMRVIPRPARAVIQEQTGVVFQTGQAAIKYVLRE